MRIGFFGNANSYPFIVARGLRMLGHEVRFIVDRPSTQSLNRPEGRHPELARGYLEWIEDHGSLPFLCDLPIPSPERNRIVATLRDCDAVILNQAGPALASEIGKPALALLTGTDLLTYTDPAYSVYAAGVPLAEQHVLRCLISEQRSGIRTAVAVNWAPKGCLHEGDRVLADLGVDETRRFFLAMTDSDLLSPSRPPDNDPIRLFCVARLTWIRPPAPTAVSSMDLKGTDVLVRGLGLFARRTGRRLDVRLVRKGINVPETEALVREEGLSSEVTWLEPMTQAEVLDEYRSADIVVDQLGSSMIGMGGLDAMAMGRPVIANGRPEVMAACFGEPVPVCQAATPEEVCEQLQRLVPHPEERSRVSARARDFIERCCTPRHAARCCLDRLEPVVKGGDEFQSWRQRTWSGYSILMADRDASAQVCEAELRGRETELISREAAVSHREAVANANDAWRQEGLRLIASTEALQKAALGELKAELAATVTALVEAQKTAHEVSTVVTDLHRLLRPLRWMDRLRTKLTGRTSTHA